MNGDEPMLSNRSVWNDLRCELLEIEMTDDRRALLALADLSRLETLRDRIKGERSWPAS